MRARPRFPTRQQRKSMTTLNADEEASSLRAMAEAPAFMTLHELVAKARQNLNQNDWDYIVGGAESETTLRRNRMALDCDRRSGRACCATSARSTRAPPQCSAARCGSPSCSRRSARWKASTRRAPPRSCAARSEFGVAHMLSSVCEPGLEAVAQAAPDALAHLSSSTCAATPPSSTTTCARADRQRLRRVLPHRRHRPLQPARARHRQALRHRGAPPRQRPLVPGRARLAARSSASSSKFEIPLVLKGIATAEDAKIAVEHGVDWIYVSNHGGRQLDHGRGIVRRAAGGRRRGRPAAPRSSSTAASTAAPTSSRRSRSAPTWSGSAACNAMRLAPAEQAGVVRMLELARGRGAALPRPARRHALRRARPLLPACRGAGRRRRTCSAPFRCSRSRTTAISRRASCRAIRRPRS